MSLATLPERPNTLPVNHRLQRSLPANSLPASSRPAACRISSQSLQECEALMILLGSGKIVVVHQDRPVQLWSAEKLCKPIRQFRPGESVYYNGVLERVRAITVY
ncbi:hypothetical protein LOC67_00505 [Stieleria sp. JC731]|uniref:hypothetical protein n=1 Tax=Pirellulaceae TaxID=2691357 RepID=UPI001E6573E9|nr:hypothetical protein [Stieleria sp. JC731]MCC9599021.1 hypothetical protein [Stieleria sp. JC731]